MEENVKAAEQGSQSHRYGRRGKRRGKYGYAAPLGIVVTLLSLLGVVALVMGGISLVKRLTDTTQLEHDLYYFLEPVLVYNPDPFEDITAGEQDAFLNAAAYRVSLAEQVRMLCEEDENCRYAVDDNGRIAVPVEEIKASYNALFGSEAVLTHRSLEENQLTFSEADNCYYVPFESANTNYVAVIDTIRRAKGGYAVRVGFVANNDIRLDDHGNEIAPTADMASYYKTYTVKTTEDGGYYIAACADQ